MDSDVSFVDQTFRVSSSHQDASARDASIRALGILMDVLSNCIVPQGSEEVNVVFVNMVW